MVAKVTFEQSIGTRHSKAAAARREVLSRALPKIEQYYSNLSKNRHLAGDAISREAREGALELYNKAVTDGRYVDVLEKDPAEAAKKLGVQASPEALRAIEVIAGEMRSPGGSVEGPVEAVIAVAVVIACAKPAEGVVIEESARVRARL